MIRVVKGNRRRSGIIDDNSKNSLILASASTARAALLRGAGLDFETRPADVDEGELKAAMKAEGAAATTKSGYSDTERKEMDRLMSTRQ